VNEGFGLGLNDSVGFGVKDGFGLGLNDSVGFGVRDGFGLGLTGCVGVGLGLTGGFVGVGTGLVKVCDGLGLHDGPGLSPASPSQSPETAAATGTANTTRAAPPAAVIATDALLPRCARSSARAVRSTG